ncbi:MAG: carboxypeptidase-like regulatory domain-containing protein [Bacteroidales bacterium]|nr:carboxypeptidase-like regulatory domain-containing protein [Bacteroidales bacterium]
MKKLLTITLAAILISALNIQAAQDDDNDSNENNATATVALKGQVVDMNSGEALTGVKVNVEGTDVSAYTDFEGNFTVQGLKPGVYELKSSYISYQDQTLEGIKLEVSDGNQLTIEMRNIEE